VERLDETWRLIHLVAAAFWLGGLIFLAVVAVIAARTLDRPTFRSLMSRTGRAFLLGSVIAWALIGVSGAAMAWPRLGYSLLALPRTDFGRLLETKTSLAVLVVALTAVHAMAGRRTDSRYAVAVSRVVSPLLFVVTLGIFWMAVRMTEG
jgi:putative copper export protein